MREQERLLAPREQHRLRLPVAPRLRYPEPVSYTHLFNRGDYAQALSMFQSVLKPPVTLGVDDFQFVSTPRAYYYIGRTLEALGRKSEADAAYEQSTSGIELLSGDRDSWNSDNFYMVLALEKLGQQDKAASLIPHFDGFARTEMDETNRVHRGQARYCLLYTSRCV